ncbi:MAG: hypothetical protein ACRDCY_09060 [Aeromonas veronii]
MADRRQPASMVAERSVLLKHQKFQSDNQTQLPVALSCADPFPFWRTLNRGSMSVIAAPHGGGFGSVDNKKYTIH